MNDTEDLTDNAVDLEPGVWLDPPLYSGAGFGAVGSESAFARTLILVSFRISVRLKIPQLALRMPSVHGTRSFSTAYNRVQGSVGF